MVIVTSLKDHSDVCLSVNPSHLISVIDPGFAPKTPHNVKNHLKLGFDDIIEIKKDNLIHRKKGKITKSNSLDNQILPNKKHIDEIIDFVESWDQKNPMVIHCWCGISRSMATATFILCKINPYNIESNIKYMRSLAPHANPNKLMLSLFESNLGADGKISEAFKKFPHTITYDCENNFAPITIFSIKDMINYK